MSEQDPRRLVTHEQRERLHVARGRGGLCAACGRALDDGEPVYVDTVVIDIPQPAGQRVGGYRTTVKAPLGAECASPALLARMAGSEPERCTGCGRPMYYAVRRSTRTRATCSRRCRSRNNTAKSKSNVEGTA